MIQDAQSLGTALGIGLLVGLERGWRDRQMAEGSRVAGLRTFGLIGLLGGLLALLSPSSFVLPGIGLACVALYFAASYRGASDASGSLSITTPVAALATYGLGMLAVQGHAVLAVGVAVIVAFLLELKEELHGWLRRIQPAELSAVLQLAVLTAVILPLLPDAGYGPYQALNPYRLWLAVILVAALSLAGHVATRLRGEHQGLMWAGLLGGLASSTAATLSLSRSARDDARLAPAAAAAIVAACGVMFLRMAVVISLLQPSLAARLGGTLAFLGAVSFIAAAWLWRLRGPVTPGKVAAEAKLFDLSTALGFGLALGAVAVLVRLAKEGLGVAGIYGVAFVSGLADVDAIVISTVQMQAQGGLDVAATSGAILLAVVANLITKAVMARVVGGRIVGWRVAVAYAAVVVCGLLLAAAQVL